MKRYPVLNKLLVMMSWLLIPGPVILSGAPSSSQQISDKTSKDSTIHKWVEQHFAKGRVPPFSFVYAGKESGTFISTWNYQEENQPADQPDIEKHLFTYRDPQGALVVKCHVTIYNDFQAVEWVLKFSNAASENTPLLQQVRVVDLAFNTAGNNFTTLHHIKGSKGGKDDYLPQEDTLKTGRTVKLSPAGGRSSDNTAFPFFNIKNQLSSGFVVAIGWTGKWYADISQTGETVLSLKAGMEKMKSILYPDEEIRTPGICLLFWKGDEMITGNNAFRRFVLAYKTRRNSVQLPLSISLSPNSPAPCNGFFGCLSDTFALTKIAQLKKYDMVPDVCWIDAGWYQDGGDNWQITGNWNVERKRFPNGLQPVSDAVHAIGSKFLLWFEPERVVEGTQLAREHETWMLKLPGDKKNTYTGKRDFVFNLGLPEARLWLTDYMSGIIKKEGIDYYRQDFNMDPQNYWNANDSSDRIGISEIRHIEGLYAFWDSLLVRFPDLIIDNCASGGRRIDLETISRSAPLWRSDYLMDEPDGLQNHTYGLNFYIPFHGTGNISYAPYDFRSGMSSTMVLFWDISNAVNSIPQMQQCMRDFKRLQPYYSGDYYPLTGAENLLRDDRWLAYQLNRPVKMDGIIMAFRRKNCPDESIRVQLRGLNETAVYELADEDSGKKVTLKGEELMKGISLSLAGKQQSLLIWYKQVTKLRMN